MNLFGIISIIEFDTNKLQQRWTDDFFQFDFIIHV